MLATFKGSKEDGSGIPVVIWGTESQSDFDLFTHSIFSDRKSLSVRYVKKSSSSFDQDLLEALASGRGPDVILLPHDSILRYKDKILPIPFESFSERDFKNTFITEGELYLSPEGSFAFPFSIDPLVMYWNRTMWSNAGLAKPPFFWDEFAALAKVLTEKDKVLNIKKSLVALGEYSNIINAKEILSAILMQAGNPIVTYGSNGLESALKTGSSALNALNFYTEFANPVKPSYSWNRSLPNSLTMFLSGDLGIYFGFGSEYKNIAEKNPNLDFDVASFPQSRSATVKLTFGKMQGLALMKSSRNKDALKIIFTLTSGQALAIWTEISGFPPVRRDLLSVKPADAASEVFYNSAIQGRGWVDPKPRETGSIFASMVESVTGGRLGTLDAIGRADAQLEALLRETSQ